MAGAACNERVHRQQPPTLVAKVTAAVMGMGTGRDYCRQPLPQVRSRPMLHVLTSCGRRDLRVSACNVATLQCGV